jgi:nitroreductase
LDLALLAPFSSNLQTWEFYWVKNPEKKAQLAKACMDQNAAKTASALIVCVARTDNFRKHAKMMVEKLKAEKADKMLLNYYDKLVPFVYSQGPFGIFAPFKWLLFFFVGLTRAVPREPLGTRGMQIWAHKSTALACENLMLAFRAAGFDSCPMEGFDEWRVKKILGLGCGAHITMVIGAGRRVADKIYGPRLRFDRNLFIKKV